MCKLDILRAFGMQVSTNAGLLIIFQIDFAHCSFLEAIILKVSGQKVIVTFL